MIAMPRHARLGAARWLIVAVLVVGCTTGATDPTIGLVSRLPSAPPTDIPSSAIQSTTATPTTETTPVPLATTATPSIALVGLGDSVAGGGHCDGCRSYILVYADLAAKALKSPVDAHNLARNDSLDSGRLLRMVRTDESMRMHLAAADIVTIGIGWNDWQGPCQWSNHVPCLDRRPGRDLRELVRR